MARLLIVEDDRDQNLLTCIQLQQQGFKNLVSAYSGDEAEEKMLDGEYDLVLLDIMMPDTTGIDLIAKLRAQSTNKRLPVIAITGCTLDDEIDTIMNAGFNDIVTKPVEIPSLVSKINKHLNK